MEPNGAASFFSKHPNNGFFFFNNLFRWLNWILAVVLLVAGATPEQKPLITAAIYLAVFVYNMIFYLWSDRIEEMLKKHPPLILIDIGFCTGLLLAYGWRSPFSVYGFAPVILTGTLFTIKASFIVAALSAAGYGLSVSLAGYTWVEIVEMGQIDSHLFEFFDYFLVATFFAYPAILGARLKESNAALLEAQAQVGRLTLAKERRRLAGDIHDSAIQSLHGANMLLGVAIETGKAKDPEITKHLDLVKEALDQALAEIGVAVDDLFDERFNEQGFYWIAQNAVQSFRKKYKITGKFCASGCETDLKREEKKALYLIIQEALSNVVKHSGADEADVSIDFGSDELTLIIHDDGHGFVVDDAASRGHGLDMMSMRARELGGTANIDSSAGSGTTLTVSVPIKGTHCQRCADDRYFLAVKP